MNTTYVSEIEQIVQMIFGTMLSIDVQRSVNDVAEEYRLLGTIQITGEKPLSVVLCVSDGVARAASAAMLQMPPAEVSDVDERDVIAELTNMVGGNLKSLIKGASFLSLPTVVEGRGIDLQVPGAAVIDDVVLECVDGTMRVRLFAQV